MLLALLLAACAPGSACQVGTLQLGPTLRGLSDGGLAPVCSASLRGTVGYYRGSASPALDGGVYTCPATGTKWAAIGSFGGSGVASLDAGGEYCAGPGGGTAGACAAGQYTAETTVRTGDGTLAAPGFAFGSATSTGFGLRVGRIVMGTAATRQFELGVSSYLYGYTDNFYLTLGEANISRMAAGTSSFACAVSGACSISATSGASVLNVGTGNMALYAYGPIDVGNSYLTNTGTTAPVLVTDAEGLRISGVAHASLSAPTSALAGTQQWDSTHQRFAVTDGGPWKHGAYVEELPSERWATRSPGVAPFSVDVTWEGHVVLARAATESALNCGWGIPGVDPGETPQTIVALYGNTAGSAERCRCTLAPTTGGAYHCDSSGTLAFTKCLCAFTDGGSFAPDDLVHLKVVQSNCTTQPASMLCNVVMVP